MNHNTNLVLLVKCFLVELVALGRGWFFMTTLSVLRLRSDLKIQSAEVAESLGWITVSELSGTELLHSLSTVKSY